MAEAPEHRFLSDKFLEIIKDFSKLKIFDYKEADRKKFDFACVFYRDWRRPLVGQTLWKHYEGIDKDIRILLTESDADIWAYIIPDNKKNRRTFLEVVKDFQSTGESRQLVKLKPLWIPPDFDADDESARTLVAEILKESIVNDILFNVIFGKLNAEDIRFFLTSTGRIGLNFAVLCEIATKSFVNYTDLSKRLGVSISPVRERVLNLLGSRFLWEVGPSYYVTLKGRVFLEVVRRINQEVSCDTITPELQYILEKLELDPTAPLEPSGPEAVGLLAMNSLTPQSAFVLLRRVVSYALSDWDIHLKKMTYQISNLEMKQTLK